MRRHAREVGARPAPHVRAAGAHRRLEGHVGPRRRPRRAGRHPPGRAARRGRTRSARATVHFLGAVDGELEADAAPPRAGVRGRSARSDPTSCSVTTRGSSTACTPITATPDSSSIDGIVAARDPHFFPERGRARTGPTRLLLFEAQVDRPRRTGRRRRDRREDRRAPRATGASGARRWASTKPVPTPTRNAPRSRHGSRDEIDAAGGEPFKLLTEL